MQKMQKKWTRKWSEEIGRKFPALPGSAAQSTREGQGVDS
jgi:hypothetical protein